MFSVIISEKGGAERRESFDRTEINVGRVQGNDLMLPKGNVSKRHARLLYRDGRFIVTDLKSTNGTYVNGRKIAQATIVREGDKIYIGDFVLRIETGSAMSPAAQSVGGPMSHVDESGGLDLPPASVASGYGGQTSAQIPVASLVGAMAPSSVPIGLRQPDSPGSMQSSLSSSLHHDGLGKSSSIPIAAGSGSGMPPSGDMPSSQPSSAAERSLGRAPSPRIEAKLGDPNRHDVISHFPLEHDPDDGAMYAVPAPPRVPSSATRPPGVQTRPPGGRSQTGPGHGQGEASSSLKSSSIPAGSTPIERNNASGTGMLHPQHGLGPSLPPQGRRTGPQQVSEGHDPAPPSRVAAHRSALLSLLDRVGEMIDLRTIEDGSTPDEGMIARVERALGERALAMKSQGELRADLDPDALVVEARRELLEYGPLTPLFEDEDVSEIQIVRSDYVVAMHGRRHVPSDFGFSSEHAVGRTLRKLCVAAGKPLAQGELFVERRLPRGARLFAVIPPASSQGHMVVIRKPQRADLTLEDLVRSGTISRAMAGLLAQCIEARANILVTGAASGGATSLLGALAAAGSTSDRVVVLQEDDELIFNQPHTISLLLGDTREERVRAVQAATRVRPDRLVIGAFVSSVAAELIDAMGDGIDGVLAAAHAPTLRQAVARLTADLAASRPGLTPEVAREWLASAFDLVLEIARLRDGRHRVLRVAELTVEGGRILTRDVFNFVVERTAAGGTVEGSFHATGHVPGIVEDLAARGTPVDPSIFKRHTGGGRPEVTPRS